MSKPKMTPDERLVVIWSWVLRTAPDNLHADRAALRAHLAWAAELERLAREAVEECAHDALLDHLEKKP